jgi:hypothetical protein
MIKEATMDRSQDLRKAGVSRLRYPRGGGNPIFVSFTDILILMRRKPTKVEHFRSSLKHLFDLFL